MRSDPRSISRARSVPTRLLTSRFTSKKSAWLAALALLGSASAASLSAAAFSGAQGYGASAAGGTTVVHVKNLNDSGAGSLRDALSATGRRVVFDLAGTIKIKSTLVIPNNTTIDGTTAPSGGITVTGYNTSVSGRHDIVVRNVRFREDTTGPSGKCAFQGADACHHILLDHCSIEWGRWDCLEFTGGSHDITVQYCIIGEGIAPQHFGFLVDACNNVSIHHNFFVDNHSRNPKLKCNGQYIDNVVYNWGTSGLVGGHSSAVWKSDVINNYFIAGPSSTTGNWINDCTKTDTWYESGNYRDTNKDGARNGTVAPASDYTAKHVTLVSAPQHNPSPAVTVDPAVHSVDLALAGSLGCQPNDAVDARLVGYLRSYGKQGQIGKP